MPAGPPPNLLAVVNPGKEARLIVAEGQRLRQLHGSTGNLLLETSLQAKGQAPLLGFPMAREGGT